MKSISLNDILDDAMDDESRPLLPRDDQNTTQEGDQTRERAALKNAVIHCLTVMFVFTAFTSVNNLDQYSGDTKSHLEMLSTWCLYVSTLSLCLLSPVVLRYLGYKWTMVASFGAQCIYAVVRFYPRSYTFAAAGILLGLTLGPFWTAQAVFVTSLAVTYGRHADVDVDVAISRFTGMFYAFLRSSGVWASLISSNIVAAPEDVIWNVSYPINETCGAAFTGLPVTSARPIVKAPKQTEVNTLLSVYVGLTLLAIIVKGIFVDDVKPLTVDDGPLQPTLTETLTSTLTIHGNGCFGLLIPVMFYNGVEQVLLLNQFTKAFVMCELGLGYRGYVMIMFAAVSSLSAFMMGQMERCCGRMLLFLMAAIFNLALLILMLQWTPGLGTKDDWLLYFIPGLWAVSDSIWQTTLVSMIAVDFRHNREGAFAGFRFWQALGVLSALIYGLHVGMRTQLYITLSLLSTSVLLYLVMEFYMKRKMNRPYIDLYAPIIE